MAGKHRGPSRKGKVDNFARLTLDPKVATVLQSLAAQEQRSVGNMISVLVTEAIRARQRRQQKGTGS